MTRFLNLAGSRAMLEGCGSLRRWGFAGESESWGLKVHETLRPHDPGVLCQGMTRTYHIRNLSVEDFIRHEPHIGC